MSLPPLSSVLLAPLVLLGLLTPGVAVAGTLAVLTYNVAGLPLGLSGSSPEVNTVQISPRLNAFDLVAVQEDFGFHEELTSQIVHPFASVKDTRDSPLVLDFGIELGLGDGLNTFSFSPFTGFTRVTWDVCFGEFSNGSDCLALKGFTHARHEIEPGVFIDVYNLHADAGGSPDDLAARRTQLRQLAAYIVAHSADEAVIVLGDTNSRYTRAGDILPELLSSTGLTDVWVELSRGGDIPEIGSSLSAGCETAAAGADCERVDKIFYRGSETVKLVPLEHGVPLDWVDADGVQLSDHEPVTASFRVITAPEPGVGLLLGLALVVIPALRRALPPDLGARAG